MLKIDMPSKSNSTCIARVNIPLYASCSYSNKHVLVAGGGGASKTGIFNGFAIYEVFHDGVNWNSKEVTRYDTGSHAIMNCAMHNNGKHTYLVVGQDSDAQVYQVKMKLDKLANISKDNLHHRHSGSESKLPEKVGDNNNTVVDVKFDIQPLVRVQADFSKIDPCLNVLRLSFNGKLLLTGGADGFVRLWEFPLMSKVWEFRAHTKELCDLDISHNSKFIATVAKTNECLVWDIKEVKKVFKTIKWPPVGEGSFQFKRCRFGKGEKDDVIRLFTITNPATRKEKKAYLQLWIGPDFGLRRAIEAGDILSALTVSHDGKYVAVGSMGSGDVDIYIAFSLQRLKHVSSAHRTFVTAVEFLPPLSNAEITDDVSLVSMSIDNQLLLHRIDKPLTLPAWAVVVIIILVICGTFFVCSLLGL